MKKLLFFAGLFLLNHLWSQCPQILDQQQTTFTTGDQGTDQWQAFMPSISGKLTQVNFYLNGVQSVNVTLEVRDGTGTTGTLLYSGNYSYVNTSNEQAMTIPFASAPVLTSGNTYTIRFLSGSNFYTLRTTADSYPFGLHYSLYGTVGDAWFKTFMTPVNPPSITVSSFVNPTCSGASDGSVTTTIISSGNGGNTFLWTPSGQTGQNATGLPANTYTVTIYDALGCQGSDNVTISDPAVVTMADPPDQTVCAGGPTSPVVFSGASSYNWTNSNPAIGLPASGSGNIPSFTAVNGGTAIEVATIVVTPYGAGCAGVTQTFTITVYPTPTVNDPPDQFICNGTSSLAVTFGGSVPGTTFNWSNSNPAIGLPISGTGNLPSFTGTNGGTTPISGTITITPTANGCTGPVQNANFVVNPTPDVMPPANQLVCAGSNTSPVVFSGSVPGTTFSWNNSDPTIGLSLLGSGNIASFAANNPGATPISGTVSVTPTANGCTGPAQNFTITVNPLPTVGFSALPDICENGGTYPLSEGSPAGGMYSGPGVSAGIFDPVVAGPGSHSLTYTFTDVNSCTNFSSQVIGVNAAPIVGFNVVPDFCEDAGAYTLSEGTPAGGTYSGSGITASTFNPGSAGPGVHPVTYSYTDVNGCSGSANQTITVNALPTVTFSTVPDFCVNDATYLLVEGTPAGGIYTGSGITGSSFNPSSAGSGIHVANYSFTDVNGCTNNANQNLTVNDLPVVGFSPLADICENASLYSLTEGTPAGGTYSGTGVVGSSFDPASAGAGAVALTYTYTDLNGCTNASNQSINVLSIPTVNAGTDSTICEGDNTTVAATGTAAGYSWDNGLGVGTSHSVSPVSTTTYTVTGTATNGCTSFDAVTVYVNPLPVVTFGPLADVCINSVPVMLSGGSPAGGTYSGTGVSAGLFDATLAGTGTHTITYTYTDGGTGCTDFAASDILVYNAPAVVANASATSICDGQSVTLTGSGASSYSWDTGVSDGIAFTPAVGTVTYTVTGTDVNGCQNTDQVDVTVNPLPAVSAGADQTNCEGDPVILSGSGALTYSWTGGVTDNTAFTPPAGVTVYMVTGTDINGCQNSDNVTVTVNPSPVLTFSPDQTFCAGDTLTLTASGADTYDWNSGAGSGPFFVIMPTVSTSVQVTGTTLSCSTPATILLTFDDPANISAGDPITVCAGFAGSLDASGAVSYEWNGPGVVQVTEPVHSFLVDTTAWYYLTAVTANGCTYIDSVLVTASTDPSCTIEPLTSFSPNGDAVNESWKIQGINAFPENHVTILNRWGDIIFDETNYDNETTFWSGTLPNGSDAPEGTYFFIIELTGGPSTTGWIQLLK